MVFYSIRFLEIIPIVSNFSLLLVAWAALFEEEYFIAIVFAVETFISLLYHVCTGFDACMGLTYWTWHDFDHFFATSMVWLAIVYIIQFPDKVDIGKHGATRWLSHRSHISGKWLKMACYLVGMLAVAIILAASDDSFLISVFAGVSFGILFIYFISYALYRKSRGARFGKLLPPYQWANLLLATLLLTYATVMFSAQESWPGLYWAIHGVWHPMASLGWCWLLLACPYCRVYTRIK